MLKAVEKFCHECAQRRQTIHVIPVFKQACTAIVDILIRLKDHFFEAAIFIQLNCIERFKCLRFFARE